MRLAMHLLLAICLVWCGLHVAEPAEAHAAGQAEVSLIAEDCDKTPEGEGRAAHLHHHHCPVAPDQRLAARGSLSFSAQELRFPGRIVPLHSLSRAPPLEPPAA